MRFQYDCPHCDSEMNGDIGEDVDCEECQLTFETDWEMLTRDSMTACLSGKEMPIKVQKGES